MNIIDLKKRIEQSRKFEITHGAFVIELRRPTEHEYSSWYLGSGVIAGRVSQFESIKLLASSLQFITNWRGVKACDFMDIQDQSEIDFDRELLPTLVDYNKGLNVLIFDALLNEYQDHYQTEQQEKKAL